MVIRSLWLRLALLQVIVYFASWLVMMGLSLHELTRSYVSNVDTQLSIVCEGLAGVAEGLTDDPQRLGRVVARFEKTYIDSMLFDEEAVREVGFHPLFQIWSADGKLLYRSKLAPVTPLSNASVKHSAMNYRGDEWYIARVWSSDKTLLVLGAESLDERTRWFRSIMLRSWWFWLGVLAASLVTTWLVARYALKPLRAVAAEIAARKTDDFSPLLSGVRYTETRPLVTEINQLLQRLNDLLQREKQFLADAAHELRTPIAAIQAQLHVYRHAAEERERDAMYTDIEQGLERAASLSRQLITVARLEADDYALTLETLDLTELARQVIASCFPLALLRDIDIRLEGDEACPVRADQHATRSVLHNLLDNAIKYGRHGGQIAVCVERSETHVRLDVKDDGPGIPQAYRHRLCERFFRVPGNDASGSGLGLAIVKTLIELQQGRFHVGAGLDGRGAGFSLILPCASPRDS